jgi:hypothetical protein
MPVSVALGADLLVLSHRLRTAGTLTNRIGKPRGAASSPNAAPHTSPAGISGGRDRGAACSCPCSVELPGEAA